MIARVLPVEEWPRLEGTEAETVWPHLDPARTTVVVVEHDGVIVGCHVLMNVLHAECLWIHPEHRGKAGVARRLWTTVQRTAKALGARTVITGACSDDIRALLAHVGAERLPADHYVLTVKG